MSNRLTNELRNTIIVKALKGYREADKAAIEARRLLFGTEVYEHTYGDVEAIVAPLSDDWRDMSDTIVISCEGFKRKYPYELSSPENLEAAIPLGRDRPFPHSHARTDVTINAEKTCKGETTPAHPLFKKARKLVQDHMRIVEAERELNQEMYSLLRSCNTLKQLEQAWPEAMVFLPKTFEHSTALVPVGLSDKINKALGIPSAASAATTATRKAAKL